MSKLETSIFIVGSKKNWQLREVHLKIFGWIIAIIFFSMAGMIGYQYFLHQYQTRKLEEQYQKERIKTQKLQELLGNTDVNFLSNDAELGGSPTLNGDELRAANELIDELQTENQQLQQRVDSLRQQIREQKPATSINSSPTGRGAEDVTPVELVQKKEEPPVTIEEFQYQFNKTELSLQFNLRNASSSIQSGIIRILPMTQAQITKEIPFNSQQVTSFSIRRFRPFARKFLNPVQNQYSAVRVTVWSREQQVQLDQYYSLTPNTP